MKNICALVKNYIGQFDALFIHVSKPVFYSRMTGLVACIGIGLTLVSWIGGAPWLLAVRDLFIWWLVFDLAFSHAKAKEKEEALIVVAAVLARHLEEVEDGSFDRLIRSHVFKIDQNADKHNDDRCENVEVVK